jgi:DNA-damage-inducible protein J
MAANSVSLDGIDESLQLQAEQIFAEQGVSASDVYRRLLLRTVEQHHIPLDLFSPNAQTIEAMRELEAGGGKTFHSVQALMDELNADDMNEDN